MDIETLDTAYQGDKDFFWLCYNGRIPDYWISKDKYTDYSKFLELFDNPPKSHVDYGGAVIQYKDDDFTYPYNICLLYTSPSPRDLSTSRMPSSA